MFRGGRISFTIFLRRRVVERVGEFDETLGVGAGTPYGSCEESDYLIRAVKSWVLVAVLSDALSSTTRTRCRATTRECCGAAAPMDRGWAAC